ncbi:uncharacterized protein LOC111271937 isoform X1 [Varroa jacobsoni]|uniref:uncharacterized protein LOC111271937 isoform X1 n=1 Tax=Varroa jacobsoni TaxID=62625 RepID=UPI000BF89D1F|nr:uncharacterized protein LOC111271937 isoform X1 [Varroa jacobsoni]
MTDSSFFEATRPHDKGYADNKCADRRCRNRTGSCDHFYTPCDFAARRGRRPATGHKSVPGILSRLEPAQALTRTRSLGQQCYNKSSLSDLSHAVDASPARDQPGSGMLEMYIAPTAILDRYSFDLEPFQHLEKHIHLGSAEIILQGTIRIWIVESAPSGGGGRVRWFDYRESFLPTNEYNNK